MKVLVTGASGLLGGSLARALAARGDEVTVLRAPKVGTERVSGAGCTLAAAITAELAKGVVVADAVAFAKDFTTAAIAGRVAAHTPFDTVWQGAYRP